MNYHILMIDIKCFYIALYTGMSDWRNSQNKKEDIDLKIIKVRKTITKDKTIKLILVLTKNIIA